MRASADAANAPPQTSSREQKQPSSYTEQTKETADKVWPIGRAWR